MSTSAWTPVDEGNGAWTPVDEKKPNAAWRDVPERVGERQPGAVSRFASSFLSTMGIPQSVQDNPSEGLQGIKLAVQHPGLLLDSLKDMGSNLLQAQGDVTNRGIAQIKRPGIANKLDGAAKVVLGGVPILGPALQNSADQIADGNVAGGLGSLTAIAAPMVAGSPAGSRIAARVGEAATSAVTPFKGSLAPRMAEPIAPGEALSRGAVVSAAQRNGINLDAATATGSPLLSVVKRGNQYTIGGHVVGEAATKANTGALGAWADRSLADYSPIHLNKDTTAQTVRGALLDHQQALTEQATNIFDDLGERNGHVKPDMEAGVDQAKSIVSDNADYYAKNPELMPKRAWSMVKSLANRGQEAPPKGRMFGQPIPAVDTSAWDGSGQPRPTPDTLSDLFKMRSDYMNEYRSADIAGTRAEGWLKQLVGTIDGTIMDEMGKLSPGDQNLFRQGNALYRQMKETYDNPQHPFYHAVRGPYDGAAAHVIGNQTPGVARDLRIALRAGTEDETSPAYSQVQRQVLQNILNGASKDGVTDFKTLDTRVGKIDPEYLNTVLGAEGARDLVKMGKVGSLATADLNTSGTAKAVVPSAEISGAIKTTLGLPVIGVNYGIARLLHSPAVLDYLTKPRAKGPAPIVLPGK